MHLRVENVINREIDGLANLWQIFHEEKQTCDQIKCYFSLKFDFLFTVIAPCLEGIQQCFQDIRFDHPFLKCYNFCNIW